MAWEPRCEHLRISGDLTLRGVTRPAELDTWFFGQATDNRGRTRRAVALHPLETDALDGQHMAEYLAMIAAWVGDNDLACEQLAIAVRPPSQVSYGQLKLLPFWDPLRGDPRFEKIVASLAPK